MRILNYAAGADTGGQSIRLHRAFTNHSDHEYRSVIRSVNYLNYPKDLPWSARGQWLKLADVIHVNKDFRTLERVAKPKVIHYHGTGFRNNPQPRLNAQRQQHAQGLASTLDLWLLAPDDLVWLPAPYDIEWLSTFRKPTDGPLRVGHAPTDRVVKSTDKLAAAVAKLNKETPVELVLIERHRWDKCLTKKGTVDVFFDQVLLGYGNNAIEAWGMGIPVIAGGAPDTLAEMRNRFPLPFYEATEDTIYDALAAMTDETTRKEWGEIGLAHAQRFHSEQAVVELLTPIYEAAKDAGPGPNVGTVGVRRDRAAVRRRQRSR